MQRISVVIPVFNERENVAPLHAELTTTLRELRASYEIIFVDDGSTDGTGDALSALSSVTVVSLRGNSGQTAALDAGIREAKGDIIITLDGDGQNDPADIPLLLKVIADGYDVVSGWRVRRQDSWDKRVISRGANILRKFFVDDGIHDSGCTLKAYRRECFEGLDLYGELHRFIPGLLRWRGYRVTEVPVNHRARRWGRTKYGLRRTLHGFLDMFGVWFWRKYSARPLHLFGGAGLFMSLSGLLLLAILFVLRFFHLFSLSRSVWPLAGFFLVITGTLLIASGLIADVMVRNYYRIHEIRPYTVRKIVRR